MTDTPFGNVNSVTMTTSYLDSEVGWLSPLCILGRERGCKEGGRREVKREEREAEKRRRERDEEEATGEEREKREK